MKDKKFNKFGSNNVFIYIMQLFTFKGLILEKITHLNRIHSKQRLLLFQENPIIKNTLDFELQEYLKINAT